MSAGTLSKYFKTNRSTLLLWLVIVLVWWMVVWGSEVFAQRYLPLWRNAPALVNVHDARPHEALVRWDSGYYISIAGDWYDGIGDVRMAFFPVLSLLIKGATAIGIKAAVFAAALNFVSITAACYFLSKTMSKYFSSIAGGELIVPLLFLSFPSAHFMRAVYTEAFFCALAFGAYYFAKEKKWYVAALLGSIASVTKLVGCMVVMLVLSEYIAANHAGILKQLRTYVIGFLAGLGWIVWGTYQFVQYGNPIAFRTAYLYGWQYQVFKPFFPHTVLRETYAVMKAVVARDLRIPLSLDVAAWWVAAGLICLAVYKKILDFPAILFGAAYLVFIVLNNNVVSVNRYILAVFPVYIVMCYILQKTAWFRWVYITTSFVLMLSMHAIMTNGFFAG